MPELPEVETYRQYLEGTSLDQKIIDIECADQRLLKAGFEDFKEALIGEKFTGTTRIGKYLFVKNTGSKVLVMHFGMTGNLEYFKDEEDRPKYAHIVFRFENGYHLGFLNRRKFGWNDLGESVEEYQETAGLATDAASITREEFKKAVLRRKTYIKLVIMDQSVTAGIGNWMADEILYQAQIHPEKKVIDMSNEEIDKIYNAMMHVIEVSVDNDAVYSDFPDDFFIHIRKKGTKCHHTGVDIEVSKVGGRTTYFSPGWQKV